MSSSYTLSDATPADAPAIASLFAQSWTSPFTRLQFGHVDPATLATAMAPRIEEQMSKPYSRFIVMRYTDLTRSGEQEVAAVAQWTLPYEEVGRKEESAQEKIERENFEDEAFRNRLPKSSNKDLVMDFTVALRRLRGDVLAGQKHYHNIATHPTHRGKGLASQLLRWVFPQADTQNLVVYLDTASDNPAKGLYQKLGFEEKESSTIENLGRYGGEGSHTHVALIRYPKTDT